MVSLEDKEPKVVPLAW